MTRQDKIDQIEAAMNVSDISFRDVAKMLLVSMLPYLQDEILDAIIAEIPGS